MQVASLAPKKKKVIPVTVSSSLSATSSQYTTLAIWEGPESRVPQAAQQLNSLFSQSSDQKDCCLSVSKTLYFYFCCMSVCLHICVIAWCIAGAHRGQKEY